VLAAFHGLKQERLALSADFALSRERRLKIRQDAARDGNQVPLRRELQKFIKRRRIHATTFSRGPQKKSSKPQ
jgi:flagellar basal body rod protein FlgB